jgi:Bacterial Ig-like domain (group 3)
LQSRISRRGLPFSILVVLAFTAPLVFAGLASAATSTPVGTSYTVNATPGADHTDPHIDGNLIAYTTATGSASSIHYYSLLTAADATIPNGGAFDFLSGVNAGRIVFSRSTPGTNGGIWLYDTTNAANPGPVPLANQPGSARDKAQIGGNTVAWQDRSTNPNSQIVAYDLTTGTTTQLTTDPTSDNLTPEVSPDGTVITWVSCQPPNDTGCNVYDAVLASGSWTVHQLSTDGADSHPDTNGSIVVYASGVIGTNGHIYTVPVAGGTPQEIAAGQPGSQANPSISGNYVSYDNFDATTSSDIYVAELRNGSPDGNLYQITNTPQPEVLSDISASASASASGQVAVTWQVLENGQWDVYAFSFTPAVQTRSTSTSVSCSPATVAVGQPSTCTATVTDTDAGTSSTPTGTVSFTSSDPGSFSGSPCTLTPTGTGTASCQVTYTPGATGTATRSETITATYSGDSTHATSSGTTTVTVQPTGKQDCAGGGYLNYGFANQGQCIKWVEHG